MATRLDPSQTTMLRKQFARDILRRIRVVEDDIWQLIVEEDALGLDPPTTLGVLAERQVWRFRTNPQKLEAFRKWLEERFGSKVLQNDATGNPWVRTPIEKAYRKGLTRAYVDSRGRKLNVGPRFLMGTKMEFLRRAFQNPKTLSKVALLASRAFEELRGITSAMATQMNRVLASGLVRGLSPRQIAKEMFQSIDGLSRSRALSIARTEVIHAHAEGQLDAFEDLGVDGVGIYAEWSTAGDDKVCPMCSALEGAILTIAEARGLIPRHPSCRCAWVPADEVNTRNRRRALAAKVRRSVAVAKKGKTNWAGKKLGGKKSKPKKKRKGY
jgi:SPP1 gp7 family putative phage head morphogenesis protein